MISSLRNNLVSILSKQETTYLRFVQQNSNILLNPFENRTKKDLYIIFAVKRRERESIVTHSDSFKASASK